MRLGKVKLGWLDPGARFILDVRVQLPYDGWPFWFYVQVGRLHATWRG